jgi:hypothetical protein
VSIKSQDIVVLVKIAGFGEAWTIRELSEALDMSLSAVHRSIERLESAGLLDHQRRVNAAQAMEFLQHGIQYVLPPKFQGESRGIPTAGASAVLRNRLAPSDSLPLVWPHPLGRTRGIALLPIHPSVPEVALRDESLAESLALIDALRVGDARLRGLAAEELQDRLVPSGPTA